MTFDDVGDCDVNVDIDIIDVSVLDLGGDVDGGGSDPDDDASSGPLWYRMIFVFGYPLIAVAIVFAAVVVAFEFVKEV